jgi:hypothetical protein
VIPAVDPSTGNLPPGEHLAEWVDVVERFGTTPWRRQLLEGLERALRDLRAAGCKRAYIDGGFITTKEHPGDFDPCWDLDGVELFPADAAADPLGTLFRDFFQRDRDGNPKGIIVIDLEDFQ